MSRSDKAFAVVDVLSAACDGGIADLTIAWEGPCPQPGQFCMLHPERSSVLLGRAISVYGVNRAPGTRASLRFLIAARGAGSAELASLRAGDKIGVSGPLGNVWPLPADRGGPIALVGGGVGTAPLSFLATRLRNGNYDYYAGFRSKRYGLSGAEGARKLLVASEDGTDGLKGRIPDFFDPNGYEAVYACGPEPMLKAVAEKCAAAGVACHLSLERRMACGAGACLGCTVRTVNGNKRCCADGPVFDAKELCFDE